MTISCDCIEKQNSIMLPIEIPLSSTYMVPASEFALLQTTRTGINYIYNRYIQMYLFGDILNQKTFDVGLSILTDPFDENPCFLTTKIESKHDFLLIGQKDSIIDCLRRGVYFYSYRYLDEYYISEAKYYKNCCMLHMFIIYGYNMKERAFYTLGYNRRGVFSKIRISFEEYDQSITNLDKSEHRYVMLISNNPNHYEKDCDIENIKFWMDQYIKSKNSRIIQRGVNNEIAITDNLIFGYRIYDYLLAYLSYFVNNEAQIDNFDFRFSRQLLEHKIIMLERLKELYKNKFIGKITLNQYKSIVDNAQVLHNLNTKLLFTHESSVFKSIYERVLVIGSREKDVLENVLSFL